MASELANQKAKPMIQIDAEKLLTLAQAAALIPPARAGRPTNISTVLRWIQQRKLDGIRVGGRWLTSVEALQRMAEHETREALKSTPEPEPPPKMSRQRRAQIALAEKEAESMGI